MFEWNTNILSNGFNNYCKTGHFLRFEQNHKNIISANAILKKKEEPRKKATVYNKCKCKHYTLHIHTDKHNKLYVSANKT